LSTTGGNSASIFKNIEKNYGLEKMLEVRRMESNAGFLRNYLNEELIDELGLIRYGTKGDFYVVEETEWKKVRDGLVNDICSRFPAVHVADKNFDQQGILLLRHEHDGRNLKKFDAIKVLNHLEELWRNKVFLETVYNGKKIIWAADGSEKEVK